MSDFLIVVGWILVAIGATIAAAAAIVMVIVFYGAVIGGFIGVIAVAVKFVFTLFGF